MSATRDLTELEGCVLGLLWQLGPCTAYAIRKEFLTSPSPHWSGSAGAIYPLIERLEGQRLIRAADGAAGLRRSKRYSLTPVGRQALRRWLGPPLADATLGIPPDPLRTRMRFLGALPPGRKASLLTEAESRLRAHLARVEEECERYRRAGEPHAYLMARGAVRMLRARLDWIREVVEELGDS
jgi:DNA-binding PadR family transcriptional regulator